MATIGYFSKQTHDTSDLYFNVLSDGISGFRVTGFDNGIAKINFIKVIPVEDAFDVAMGCFETSSNFRQELLKVYKCDPSTELKGIQFDVLDGSLFVSPTTTADERSELIHNYYANMPMRPSVSSLCW